MITRLIEIRGESKKSQEDVAREIGITKGYYSMIENGKRGLSYDLAEKIAAVFDLNPDDIFLKSEFTKSK